MTKNLFEKFLVLGLLFLSGVGCDQTTKRIAEQTLSPSSTYSYFFDTVRIQLIKNSGAFLGFGAHFSEQTKFWLFIVFPILLLSCGLLLILLSRRIEFIKKVMVVLMLSGGIGNLIDRIMLDGAVTDFINIGIGNIRTGIFNIADVAIMLGVIGLFCTEFFRTYRRPSPNHLD